MKKKTKILFARIPVEWDDKIKKIAEKECRSEASVVRQAIKEFLEKKKE